MKLIILDRDGVINQDSDKYIKSPQEWIPIEGSIEAIASLKKAGYHVAIATNQSGIARGYYDVNALHAMHEKMAGLLQAYSVSIDHIAFCPHGPDDNCDCRKPRAGMLFEIANTFDANLAEVTMVGDTLGDMWAAQAAGAKFVLVKTGKGERVIASGELPESVVIYDDLLRYTQQLLERHS